MDPQQILQFPHIYRRIMDGDEVRIGDRARRVIIGYGRAPGRAALHCCAPGVLISDDRVVPKIPALIQRGLDRHRLFFAMGIAMARLHYLFFLGSLRRQTGADGVIRYVQDRVFRKGVAR